ncbi:MAG: signal peptide peptidase SppA [Halomonas sp.]|jgi:protease-4|uniref:Signal peptide peptidase SppA n=1 Tax=Billgrantia tianxiuensis TaxID=2497861 RepID=A0A6I6SK56_9GAMM|nr:MULTISPECIES: signal peptide peptidase SppA [Halomonas]MCE8032355.1 signal peptide peptidase SppA [Halomonas sp. MCCC 1A11057]MDX5432618.1 signal peptide peptidase SppA [Halomonas sp.]QHC49661.1 signal peptide peptidase SppA [Halomonas tianxiuensis]
MSDDKREDRWTEGPELTPEQAREAQQAKQEKPVPPPESAETLRERQRLAQQEMLDRWIDGVLVEQRRSRRWKLFFRFFFAALILASLAATFYSLFGDPTREPERRHLGVVEVHGVIDSESPASAERIIEGLNRAWEAANAAVVVLHIDSPGGSPVQSQRVYDEIMRLREEGGKPIIAVIEDVGASGAYYMAAAADEIVAAPASLVGSIGVIFASFGFEEAIDRLGIERRVYVSGENKGFLDPFSPVAPEEREFWQTVMDTTHGQFIEAVRQGRGERLAEDERLFSGLIWSGQQALELGLIDGISSLDALSRELFGEVRLHDYTPRLDPFERLSRQFGRVAAEWMGVPSSRSPVRYQLP